MQALEREREQYIVFRTTLVVMRCLVVQCVLIFDGAICKTQKSALMKSLEKNIEHHLPLYIDVLIIDGFFLLHTMKSVPKTFGNISKKMLQMVTQLNASTYEVIFDQYFTPSIKNYERLLRQECTQLDFIDKQT